MGALEQLRGGESIGRYRLERILGRGGMAEVFAATHQGARGFERPVCIKRILPFFAEDGEFRKLFVREARFAGLLNHSNIVQVFDCIEDGPTLAIVMEIVDGTDLAGLNRALAWRDERMAQHLVATVGAHLLLGLAYAHQQEIVHRDISPHNVLVSREGEVKIVDFGVAKAMFSHVTRTGEIKGKLAYMSPEQALGKPVDMRTDLYSLGLVLYELLTGQRFFKQNHQAELIGAVTHAQRPVLEDAQPALARLIEGLLEPDREHRFQTAEEALRSVHGWRAFGPRCTTELRDLVRRVKEEEERPVTTQRSGELRSPSLRTDVLPDAAVGDRLERPIVPGSPNAPTATREDDVRLALELIATQEMDAVSTPRGELDSSLSGYLAVASDVISQQRRGRSKTIVILLLSVVVFTIIGFVIGASLSRWRASGSASPRADVAPKESRVPVPSESASPVVSDIHPENEDPPTNVVRPTEQAPESVDTANPSPDSEGSQTGEAPLASPQGADETSVSSKARAGTEARPPVHRSTKAAARSGASSRSQRPRAIRGNPLTKQRGSDRNPASREGIRESPF